MDDPADDVPSSSDYALYLVHELARLLRRADLTEWSDEQAGLFRRRFHEISAMVDARV